MKHEWESFNHCDKLMIRRFVDGDFEPQRARNPINHHTGFREGMTYGRSRNSEGIVQMKVTTANAKSYLLGK